jgi:hypothetical protein
MDVKPGNDEGDITSQLLLRRTRGNAGGNVKSATPANLLAARAMRLSARETVEIR